MKIIVFIVERRTFKLFSKKSIVLIYQNLLNCADCKRFSLVNVVYVSWTN